jgi:hypothetical protein
LEGGKRLYVGGDYCSGGGEFVLRVFGEPEVGGTSLLGILGTGARISIRYLGARKPDKLLLAGREETWFGQSWSAHQAAG